MALGLCLFLGLWLGKKISDPLLELSRGAEEIGKGHLNHKIALDTGDEVSVVARAFNHMAEKLRGSVTSIDELNLEIARRAEIEQELRQNQENFENIIQNNIYGVVVVDHDGRCLFANTTAEDILDKPNDALIGAQIGLPIISGEMTEVELPGAKGSQKICEMRSVNTSWAGEKAILVMIRDITEFSIMQNNLLKSQLQLDRVANSVPGMVFQYRQSSAGEVSWLFVSSGVNELLGLTTEQMYDDPDALNAILNDDLESIQRLTEESIKNLTPWRRDLRFKLPDGSEKWVDCQSVPQREKNGAIVWFGVMMDVTSRVEMEERLNLLSVVAEQAPISVMITDLSGNLEYVNKSFENKTGYTRAEVIGKNPRFLKSGYTSQEEYKKLWETIIGGQIWYGILENKRKDGALLLESASITPVRDSQGQYTHYLALKEDITEKNRMEETAEINERNYTTMFNASKDAITVISPPDWKFVNANNAALQLFGAKNEEELMTKGPWDVSPEYQPNGELSAPQAQAMIQETLRKGENYFKWNHKRLNGTVFPATILLSKFESGGKECLMATIRDISEIKKLEEQLLQSQKMEAVGKLAGGVAHDFNNLLTVINGYSEMILSDLTEDAPFYADLKEILSAGKKARDITKQLLVFARRDAYDPKVFYVRDMIKQSKTMLRRLLPENIEISVLLDEEKIPIKADPGQIEQVLVNLIVNARDAMPDGGRIIIELKSFQLDEAFNKIHGCNLPNGKYLMFSITDTGQGMEKSVLNHIFEPFFTTKPKDKGTGLGLATSYGIIDRCGGIIKVYSELGLGTTFKIFLPQAMDKLNINEKVPEAVASAQGTENILLVEDDRSVGILAQRILEKNGYKVFLMKDGPAAIKFAKDNVRSEIHLLLTDVIMPKMNGKEVAQRIQELYPDIKVLYCSGYSRDVIVSQGTLEKGIHLIQKPYTPDLLTKTVRKILDQI